MTAAQVLKWFCKEQKIMGLIFRMYHEAQPYCVELKDKVMIRNYMSFEEYMDDTAKRYGIRYLLEQLNSDYLSKIRNSTSFFIYIEERNQHNERFSPLLRKWEYFVEHNILIDGNFEIGDTVTSRTLNSEKFKIEKIDVPRGGFTCKSSTDGYTIFIHFYTSKIGDEKKDADFTYFIKRRRKIYNGKN